MVKVVIPLEITVISSEILPVIRRIFHPDATALTLVTVRPAFDLPPVMVADPMRDVITPQMLLEQSAMEWQARRRQAQTRLQEIAYSLRCEGYAVTTVILEGEVVSAIAAFVNHHKFDLLAMATFGRTGLDRLLNGSIAESLLRQVTTPMLLLRHQPSPPPEDGERLPRVLTSAPVMA